MNSSIPDYEPISLKGSGCFGYVFEAMDRIHNSPIFFHEILTIKKILINRNTTSYITKSLTK